MARIANQTKIKVKVIADINHIMILASSKKTISKTVKASLHLRTAVVVTQKTLAYQLYRNSQDIQIDSKMLIWRKIINLVT